MNDFVPRIAEQDGRVIRIVAGNIEVLSEMDWAEDELILFRLSIDRPAKEASGLANSANFCEGHGR